MSDENNCADSSSERNKNIRRATLDDIEELIEICSIILPNCLIWCTRRCARKWWDCIIRSKSRKTWVYQFNNEIVALVRFVIDQNSYKKEIQKLRPCFSTLPCVFIIRPRLLFIQIMEILARVTSSSVNYSDASGLGSLADKSMWFHSFAALPSMRGKGIGTNMIQFCEQRAVNLGFGSVKCFIKTNNNVSIRLHERLGFVRAGEIKDRYSFIKLLSKNHNN